MIRRPKLGETEEDLLHQQEEFLRGSGKESLPKRKHERNGEKSPKRFEVLGDVVEKREFPPSSRGSKSKERDGFPKTFLIDPTLSEERKGKKSLFSIQMEKNKQTSKEGMEIDEARECSSGTTFSRREESFIRISNSLRDVHEENLEKLSQMSEKEILEEQKKLLETLDPNLVAFLKDRNKQVTKTPVTPTAQYSENNDLKNEGVKEILENYVDSKWINMDFIEKEKLEWIGDIPDKSSLEPNRPYSARFNFEGELQPFVKEIDVRNALYHHGEEPNRPGYTVQELYQLSRSNILQQRILALNTLANIIRKTKLGYYDRCFDGQLLHKLVEADLFFLLRFSIDEKPLVPASINCLHNLLCNESDEFCLDKLLGVLDVDQQPILFNKMETEEEEEKELKDHVVIANDLIKGVLRTDLLVRLSYVFNSFRPSRETLVRGINCLIRIARHSPEATIHILKTKNLLKIVYNNLNTNTPVYQGVKLLRIMSTHSQEIASAIFKGFDVKFLISFVEADDNKEISKKDFYLLKLETIYFWRTLLHYNLFVNEFVEWSPRLGRLLLFYVEKVNVSTENEFDFELFSALTSLIITCNRKKVSLNVGSLMKMCLEKWLTQLRELASYNFSISKAIGCILRYFTSHYKSFEVTKTDLDFILKTHGHLVSLFEKKIFDEMAAALKTYSYVLSSTVVKRDPDNLPSLCSVYDGGDELLRIVHSFSPLPLFMSLARYLKASYRILNTTKTTIGKLFDCIQLRKYITRVYKCNIKEDNWFMKYETDFLTNILSLLVIVENQESINLSFRLLPMMRVDNKKARKVLQVICDDNTWKMNLDFLETLYYLCSELLLERKFENSTYKNDLIPEEWPYKLLSLLRGNEDLVTVTSALRFISFILDMTPKLFGRISYTLRYYYLCAVFLTDSNVLDSAIQTLMSDIFRDIIENRYKVNLNIKYEKNKSFYDLYTELITQYAGVSYGLPVFAKFVLFPLQNRFNVSLRKLLWSEYMHVLRVISIPYPVDDFVCMSDFVGPMEFDESLLVTYMNSVSSDVIMKRRNPFVYYIAIGNVKTFLDSPSQDERLSTFLRKKIKGLKRRELREDILNFSI